MSEESSWGAFKYIIKRSTLANIVAAGLVITGIGYFVFKGDTENVKTLVLLGAGVLFKTVVDTRNGN